ncbi:MAG: hypothetical protein ACP5VS_08760 [Desulfomonilaceae bacterium]
MIRKKKKKPSVRDTEEFKELIKDLRKQVPDEKQHLQERLDNVISETTDTTDNR